MGSMTLARRFELLSRLGSGQSGEVWAALDSKSGSDVAVKKLAQAHLRTSLEGELEWRLRREFRLLADFRHSNLVRMFELVLEDGELWLVMERIVGVPL